MIGVVYQASLCVLDQLHDYPVNVMLITVFFSERGILLLDLNQYDLRIRILHFT
jgi:hypothetical protein